MFKITSFWGAFIHFGIGVLVGPFLFYLVIYWWFIPIGMRFDLTFANPSVFIKILMTLLVIPAIYYSRIRAEILGKSIDEGLINEMYGLTVKGADYSKKISLFLFFILFLRLIGVISLSSFIVFCAFLVFIFYGFLYTLKNGLALCASNNIENYSNGMITKYSAIELMDEDPRPPIIYLRSFTDEQSKASAKNRFNYLSGSLAGVYMFTHTPTNFSALYRDMFERDKNRKISGSIRSTMDEQMFFAQYLSEFGPYIAIGRPGESFESMDLGAAKLYVNDEDWQKTIIELIESANVVVLEAGESAGLSWEISQLVSKANPQKVLMILPRHQSKYDEFCLLAEEFFPESFPEDLPVSRLLMFEDGWIPVELNNPTMSVEDALRPFIERLGLVPLEK